MRARRRPQAALVASLAALALPPLPHGWPHRLQIGLTESPTTHAPAKLGFRYQYLAGGVNTGDGWSTWNPNGTFASTYVRDSWAHGEIPVLTYYMLLQSSPSLGDEAATDLGHLRDEQLMQSYWRDVTLLLRRVAGKQTVVVHVEPDLWGYLEQANAVAVGRAFAQRWIALRNRYAPNVLLAYHMSGWGTKHDIVYEDPPDATVKRYAEQSAAFYRALHARFDVAFEDFSDRDAGFYEQQQGNAKTWFTVADFHRHLLYGATFVKLAKLRLVAWQIPLGNMHLDDTWGHYRDNRVEWLLGTGSRGHLRAYATAGYVGFLFGGGADGTTSAATDGGYFYARDRAYYAAGPLKLP
ncbi:MAG TPA: hypothetical protein VGK79_12930 [Gaiellaceae bacterium]